MKNIKSTGNRATKWMRWIARGIGLLNGIVWLSQVPGILVYSVIPLPRLVQATLLTVPFLGLLIAWRWERIGGMVLVINTIAFAVLPPLSYVMAGLRQPKLSLVDVLLVLPGLIAGILFLVCWRRTKTWSDKKSGL